MEEGHGVYFLLDSSGVCTRNLPQSPLDVLMVQTGRERNHRECHKPLKGCLPSHSVSRPSRLAALHPRGFQSRLLRLPFHMYHLPHQCHPQCPSHVTRHLPPRNKAPVPRNNNSSGEHDVAGRLRKERQTFYLKAASAARANVKMDKPKPPLTPPLQPPGLFQLLQCGLLKFDLECGSFTDFQQEVDNWRNDPNFMDRLCAAYGRFHIRSSQVHIQVFHE
jgi:hypothetical protein